MKKSTRGVVDPVTWAVIGLIAVGSWAYVKVFEPGRNKKVADKIAVATEKANKEAEAAKALSIELQKSVQAMADAHAQETKTEQKMRANAADFNGQNKAVLAADPNPSPYTLIAIGLCDSVDQSLGIQSTAEQRLEWSKRVIPLLQHNAEIEKLLAQKTAEAAALSASLKAEHEHAVASDAHAATLAKANTANVATIATITAKAEKLAGENANWAAGTLDWKGRLKAAVIGLCVLGVLLFILSWRYRGKDKTLTDSVALGEFIKTQAIGAGHKAEELETKIKDWMQGDHAGMAAIDKVKEKLRI
jgi:hypothetical protein